MINSSREFLLITTRLAFYQIKNSLNRAIFCSVFFPLFSFSCPSRNFSSDTLSTNLEVPEEDATILVKADSERRENRYDMFLLVKIFRLRPVIGYTIILDCEKNCPTSQIASNF